MLENKMINELKVLLNKLDNVYSSSQIKKEDLYYSLITGALKPNSPLILGFNWGAASNELYEPQKNIEANNWLNEDTGSFKRIVPFCDKFFPEINLENASQSNYCYFRSKKENHISRNDIQLCLPIFDEMLSILNPSVILAFSVQLRNYLASTNSFTDTKEQYIRFNMGASKRGYTAFTAKYKGGHPIYFLPHPAYPMTGEAREKAWSFCSQSILP